MFQIVVFFLFLANSGARAAETGSRWIYSITEGGFEVGLAVMTNNPPKPAPTPTSIHSYTMFTQEQPQRTIDLDMEYIAGKFNVTSYTRTTVIDRIQAQDTFRVDDMRWNLINYVPPWPPLPFEAKIPAGPWLPLDYESIASLQLLATFAAHLPSGTDSMTVLIEHIVNTCKIVKTNDERGDLKIRATVGNLTLELTVERLTGILRQVSGLPWDRKIVRYAPADKSQTASAQIPANSFEIEEISIPASGGVRLQGILKRPVDVISPPVVLFIDDINHVDPLGRGLLDDIGSALAKRGIASLIYYQRGMGGSGGDFEFITMETLTSDAESVLSMIKARADLDVRRIGALGYGIGGFTALVLAAHHSEVHAVVGMATMAVRPYPTLLNLRYRQRAQLLNWSVEDLREALESVDLSSEALAKSSGDWLQFNGRVYPVPFARSAAALNVREMLTDVVCPVLLIHGTKDLDYPFQQMNDLKELLMEIGAREVEVLPIEGSSNDLGPWVRFPQSAPLAPHRYAEPQLKKQLIAWLEKML